MGQAGGPMFWFLKLALTIKWLFYYPSTFILLLFCFSNALLWFAILHHVLEFLLPPCLNQLIKSEAIDVNRLNLPTSSDLTYINRSLENLKNCVSFKKSKNVNHIPPRPFAMYLLSFLGKHIQGMFDFYRFCI